MLASMRLEFSALIALKLRRLFSKAASCWKHGSFDSICFLSYSPFQVLAYFLLHSNNYSIYLCLYSFGIFDSGFLDLL